MVFERRFQLTNRQRLVNHLKLNTSNNTDDPLYNTNNFLERYDISQKLFYTWLIDNFGEYSSFNSDRDICITLQ